MLSLINARSICVLFKWSPALLADVEGVAGENRGSVIPVGTDLDDGRDHRGTQPQYSTSRDRRSYRRVDGSRGRLDTLCGGLRLGLIALLDLDARAGKWV